MYSTFFGLQIAGQALATHQAALDVTGHNIANSNNSGYTRQVANIQAAIPLNIPVTGKQLTLGAGSTLDSIQRARDHYIDRQFRWETSKYQYWEGKQEALAIVESLMNEPSQYSLGNDLDKFWNSWSDLAKNPQNTGARAVLYERAMTLTDTLHYINQQITDMQADLDASVKLTVNQINIIADQIKELNIRIKKAEVTMDNANDLKDRRDNLVDELAKLVPVRVVESQDPNFTDRVVSVYKIIIGNEADPNNVLVNDQIVRHLQNPAPDVNGFGRVVWEGLDPDDPSNWVDLGNTMGKLQAVLEIRDEYLVNFRNQLDTLTSGIFSAVNLIHQAGQGLKAEDITGIDFFTLIDDSNPVSAANITVNPLIKEDLDRIATGIIPLDHSTVPPTHVKDDEGNDLVEVGDASIALAIASLAEGWEGLKDFLSPGDPMPVEADSFTDYYGSVISKMGVDVQQCQRMAEGQAILVNHMYNQRETLSGVSLDEEMANLIRFQKSYGAAARLVTMLDSMFERILGMGVTR